MRKSTTTETGGTTPVEDQATDTPPATTSSPDGAADPAAPAPEDAAPAVDPALNPDHEWPSAGGCYVRQPDGTLTRED